MRRRWLRWLLLGVAVVVGLFLLIQLVPYGRSHTNPSTRNEPRWDSPQTRELAKRACFDCHSNETTWPWYSNVAPVSWLVQSDVDSGRATLNFSDWTGAPQGEAGDVPGVVRRGEMPPRFYPLMHGGAKLSPTEREALATGLARTIRGTP